MNRKYEQILGAFKKNGGRITEQRKLLVEVILNNPGCTRKEIYYLAKSKDKEIGRATVYRIVRSLCELGF